MEMTQYQKDLVRMWDSIREKDKGESRCASADCKVCPLFECCYNNCGNTLFAAEKAIEIVSSWAKEHPIVTMAGKYKEIFGIEPKNINGDYLCPYSVGFTDIKCKDDDDCKKCRYEFWSSEYKEPKKESE